LYADQPAAKEGEAAQKQNGNGNGNGEQQPTGQNNELAQLKEQLEKKDKEIVDLKVSPVCLGHQSLHPSTSPSAIRSTHPPNTNTL
jgi:hypothetical protein